MFLLPASLGSFGPVSLVAFALSLEQLGLVLSILLLVGIGSLAARGIKAWEALAAALGLIVLSYVPGTMVLTCSCGGDVVPAQPVVGYAMYIAAVSSGG